MHQDITPIAVRPWTLNGISERMIVSHYENNYGGAVRTLNALRNELAGLQRGVGASATASVAAFVRTADGPPVPGRRAAGRADRPLPQEDPSDTSLPSLSVEELSARLAKGESVQVLDARPRHHISRTVDLMAGAARRGPPRGGGRIGQPSPRQPVAPHLADRLH